MFLAHYKNRWKVVDQRPPNLITSWLTWKLSPQWIHWMNSFTLVWWPRLNFFNSKLLLQIQRLGCLSVTGAMSITPTAALEAIPHYLEGKWKPPNDVYGLDTVDAWKAANHRVMRWSRNSLTKIRWLWCRPNIWFAVMENKSSAGMFSNNPKKWRPYSRQEDISYFIGCKRMISIKI